MEGRSYAPHILEIVQWKCPWGASLRPRHLCFLYIMPLGRILNNDYLQDHQSALVGKPGLSARYVASWRDE